MISKSKEKLIHVGEAIKSLLFPFSYDFTFIPYLPETLIHYL